MRIKAIKGTKGIGTERKNATYVEAAGWGKYRGWRYVLGLVIILFAWMVAANFASAIVALALGGQEGVAAFSRLDYAAFGPVGGFVVVMAGFPVFLAGVLIAITLIHQRHPRTLITAREKISWRRVGHGFVAGFVPWVLLGGLGQYLLYPDTFSFNSDLKTFALGGQADPSVLSPVEYYLFVMASFLFFLAGILIAVFLVHRRHPRTLVTARERIDWHRVGHGFVAWFVPFITRFSSARQT